MVLGVLCLFSAPVIGITRIAASALLSSDWKYRKVATGVLVAISLVVQHLWLVLIAAGIGAFLFHKKVPHYLSYFFWTIAAVNLLSGEVLLGLIVAVCGAALWKLTP